MHGDGASFLSIAFLFLSFFLAGGRWYLEVICFANIELDFGQLGVIKSHNYCLMSDYVLHIIF